LIAAGFILQKKFTFDVKVLSKLLFNLYIPVLVFVQLLEIEVSINVFGKTLMFLVIFSLLIYLLAFFYVKLKRVKASEGATIINATLFYNIANYGIPLVLLVYPNDPLAFSIQIVVVLMQTILIFTVGVIIVNAGKKSIKALLMTIARIPVIYAIVLSLLFRALNLPLPNFIYTPLTYISSGYVAIALVTLGVQLGNISWRLHKMKDVFVVNIFRLVLSPAIAFILVLLFNLEGTVAQVLIISSAAPTAVNSAMLAIEYENSPETASQIVLTSTLLSAFTIPMVILFVKTYFS
jgi:predicted permease